MLHRIGILTLIALSLCASNSLAAQLQVFNNVRSEWRTTRVSDDGSTVIGTHPGIGGWRWKRGDGLTSVALLPSWPTNPYGGGSAVDLSADGSAIMGNYINGGTPPGYIWSESPSVQPLAFEVWGKTLAADGRAAFGTLGANVLRWTADGAIENLNLNHQVIGRPSAASADGSVVAFSSYVWSSTTGLVPLNDGSQPSASIQAWGISGDGSTVVGQIETVVPPGNFGHIEAFRWTSATGLQNLGALFTLPPNGAKFASATAASFDGTIIVGDIASLEGAGVDGGAFMWDAVHGMRSLESVAESRGIDLQGQKFSSVDDMSPDGRYIVGALLDQNGANTWAYLLDLGAPVPEPAGVALAAVALAALHGTISGRRRRTTLGSDRRPRTVKEIYAGALREP